MENIVFEDQGICVKCGGYCCRKCGCDYSANDFSSLNINLLQKKLEEGDISIVSAQYFKEMKGILMNEPILYLRARNLYRPKVDLLSMKTTCASLIDDHCKYSLEERPSGGVNLIPVLDMKCYPYQNPIEIVNTWIPYQKVLSRLVKRFTGKSVDEKLREDVYQLFYDVYCENFEGVSEAELLDIANLLPLLQKAYPNEFNKAVLDVDRSKKHVLVK